MSEPDFSRVRALLFDVDGVMTDGRVLASETGQLLRSLDVRDGYALKVALRADLRVAIVTGGVSEGVRRRFAELGVADYYSGVEDKLPTVAAYLRRHGVPASEAVYMGDDLPDLPPMRHVGVGCAPADACAEALAVADYVTAREGGRACVREVVERVLRARASWPAA